MVQPNSQRFDGRAVRSRLFLAGEHFDEALGIDIIDRNRKLSFQVVVCHPVEENWLVRFNRGPGYNSEIADDLVTNGEQILAREQAGHRDVAAEIGIWNSDNR